MQRKVTKLENSHIEVVVTVDEKTWVEAQKKAFAKEAKNVTIPGFRKGNAPESMVKSKVSQAKVYDEAINALLPVLYSEALKEEKIEPFAQPNVDVTKLSEKELEVKFVIPTFPEVKLGSYKGLKVGKISPKVTEKDVDEAINTILKNNATLVVKEAEAVKGDTVVMDFVGTIDGVAFEGGSATNHELELGSNSFIPGFEDQLVGTKAGEEKDVKVTFPENYTPELKGKDANFHCTIHEVKEKKLPELNDEFVKEQKIKDVENVEAFKAHKKAELKETKERDAKNEFIDKALKEIAKNSTFSIPEEAINSQVESRKKDILNQMKQYNMDLEKYLQIIGQTEEQFNKTLEEQSRNSIVNYLIINEIAKLENIVVDEAALEAEYAKLAAQYNMKVEDVKKALAGQDDQFKDSIKQNKASEFIFTNND